MDLRKRLTAETFLKLFPHPLLDLTRMLARFLLLTVALSVLANATSGLAQVTEATVKATIDKAAAFLREEVEKSKGSAETSLAAYALIKAGDNPNSPLIQKVLNEVASRTKGSEYKPGHHGIYAAGVELMLLAEADPSKYQQEMQAIVQYLIKQQRPNGSWDYPHDFRGGDTSQCQYAMLGLWAAERAGIPVPPAVWDRGAQWFLKAQSQDGGFKYHPFGTLSIDGAHTNSTTGAGAGSLLIARMQLYPYADDPSQRPAKPSNAPKFGVLEAVDLDTVESQDGTKNADPKDYKPTVSSAAMLDGAKRSAGWLARRYQPTPTGRWPNYYLYTMERMAAFLDIQQIAGRDWYRDGAAHLMKVQQPNGAWKAEIGEMACTALGVLFLTKSTAKILNREVSLEPIGTGLLAGGRGLPDDLNTAILKDGKVESAKDLGPIDQLLAELEKVESVDIESTQTAIVEQVQLGDREELIKQKDRLVKLATHPNVEIKRTAIWALGRTQDMRTARLLVNALDDGDVDVVVEARNALCMLSRKPLGFGLPESPFQGLPPSATEHERNAAFKAWREKLKETWGEWYFTHRPYDERDDLPEALFRGK